MSDASEETFTLQSVDGLPLEAAVGVPEGAGASVLLAYGFGVDLHEEGVFDRLAAAFLAEGMATLRFSFRGHGGSGGTQEGMTIAGERLDVTAAYRWLVANLPAPHGIVAASFGGVATLVQLASFVPAPRCLVLWNPALEPSAAFGPDVLTTARANGFVDLREGRFRAGQVFIEERLLYPGNLGRLHLGGLPALIVHGTADSLVPIAWSRQTAQAERVELVEIKGAEHGFHEPEHERLAVETTVAWAKRTLAETGLGSHPRLE